MDGGEGTIGQMKKKGKRKMRKDKEEGEEGPEGRCLCSGKYWTIKHSDDICKTKKNPQKDPSTPPQKKKRARPTFVCRKKAKDLKVVGWRGRT